MSETTEAVAPVRKVGLMLGIGIFFLPIFFVWLLLRKGHSTRSRVIGFGWLALVVLIGLFGGESSTNGSPQGPTASGESQQAAALKIGETIPTSGATVQIKSVITRDAVGSEYIREAASEGGILVVVRYALTNTGDKPLGAYDRPNIKLMDAAGVIYDPDIAKSSAYAAEADSNTKIFSDLNPGITTYGAEVFEVGRDRYDPKTWRVMVGDKSTLVTIE